MLNLELNKFANKIELYLNKNSGEIFNLISDEFTNENYFLILSKFNVSSPVYLSKQAANLIGFKTYEEAKDNWFFIENIIDIDSTNILTKALKHFFRKPDKDFDMCYQVKTIDGEKKWVYAISRVLSFTKDNRPDFILTIGVDIKNTLLNQIKIKSFKFLMCLKKVCV